MELCTARSERWHCAAAHTRSIFLDAWSSYESHAFGHDEVRPLTNVSRDNWGGLAITMIDALDSMLLLGLEEPYERARKWLLRNLPQRISGGGDVPFFEVTIRGLGGLLGAHTLRPDPELLALAAQLGYALLPALAESPSGVPLCTVHLASGRPSCPDSDHGESIPLSELGSVQLEFGTLAELVGDARLAALADGALSAVRRLPALSGLYPSRLRPRSGGPASKEVGFGSGSDSFYETLLKRWLHGGKRSEWLRGMYAEALGGLRRLLRRSEPSGLTFLARADAGEVGWRPRSHRLREAHLFEHLSCYVPGMLGLGAHAAAGQNATAEWALARELLQTCTELYERQPAGLGPERVSFVTAASLRAVRAERRRMHRGDNAFDEGEEADVRGEPNENDRSSDGLLPILPSAHDYAVVDARWPLRPEYVESLYVLWRLEPPSAERDARRDEYRERGLRVLRALQQHCRTPMGGYAGLASTGRPPRHANLLESFFFSETLKYLHLLFTDEAAFSFDTHMLTTEAHVLPVLAARAGLPAPPKAMPEAQVTAEVQASGEAVPHMRREPWWRSEDLLDE